VCPSIWREISSNMGISRLSASSVPEAECSRDHRYYALFELEQPWSTDWQQTIRV
jgi:hypothetical protein